MIQIKPKKLRAQGKKSPIKQRIDSVFVSSGFDELPFVRSGKKKPVSRAVIDPLYGLSAQANRKGSRSFLGQRAERMVARLKKDGVIVYSESSTTALRQMIRDGIRVKRFRINFPYPYFYDPAGEKRLPKTHYLRDFIKTAREVLEPNGKVYIRSEEPLFLNELRELARKEGWKTKPVYRYPKTTPVTYHGSEIAPHLAINRQNGGVSIPGKSLIVYELVLTNGLKRAIPSKVKRKRLTS